MGDIADSLINGEFDFITGEYLDGESPGYPRTLDNMGNVKSFYQNMTPSEKKIRDVKIELKKLIKSKQKLCTTEKEKNQALEIARQEINKKYGKGWRERGLISGSANQWTKEDLEKYSKPKKK